MIIINILYISDFSIVEYDWYKFHRFILSITLQTVLYYLFYVERDIIECKWYKKNILLIYLLILIKFLFNSYIFRVNITLTVLSDCKKIF